MVTVLGLPNPARLVAIEEMQSSDRRSPPSEVNRRVPRLLFGAQGAWRTLRELWRAWFSIVSHTAVDGNAPDQVVVGCVPIEEHGTAA